MSQQTDAVSVVEAVLTFDDERDDYLHQLHSLHAVQSLKQLSKARNVIDREDDDDNQHVVSARERRVFEVDEEKQTEIVNNAR